MILFAMLLTVLPRNDAGVVNLDDGAGEISPDLRGSPNFLSRSDVGSALLLGSSR